MKITYVLASNLVCGGHIVVLQHITRLAKRGYDVSICLLDDNIPASPESFSWFPSFSAKVVHRKDFSQDTDISVATFWGTALTTLELPAKYKVYFVQCNEINFYDDCLLQARVALTYMCPFIFMTEARWLADWLKNKFWQDAEYVPNGFDAAIVHPVEPIELKPLGKYRVLIEGPLDAPFKRVREAIQVCQGVDCEVWCVSNNGELTPDLKVDRFFYKVPFDEMKYLYSSCDILIKISSVEGVFGPPLEMMACGGVCIVSDVNGYDEYIKHEYNALVVPNGDIQKSRESLQRLIQDPALYQRLRENGLLTAKSKTWDDSINILEHFLNSLPEKYPNYYADKDFQKYVNIMDIVLAEKLEYKNSRNRVFHKIRRHFLDLKKTLLQRFSNR
jgi:O-antigen biosynthesis protein